MKKINLLILLLALMMLAPSLYAQSCGGTTVTNSNVTASSATINWGAVTGATSYNIIYNIDNQGWNLADQVTTTTYDLTGLPADANVQVCIDVYCGSTVNNNGNCTSFITTSGGGTGNNCGSTTLTASDIGDNTATIDWTAVSNATSYNLIYSDGTTWELEDQYPANTTTGQLTDLLPNTEYTVCVDVYCGSELNQDNCITITTTDGMSTCEAPSICIEQICHNSVTISWPPAEGAEEYAVWVKNFGNNFYQVYGTYNTNTTSVTVSNLQSNMFHFIKLRVKCNGSYTLEDQVQVTTPVSGCITSDNCAIAEADGNGDKITLDLANVSAEEISSHILGANRNHVNGQLADYEGNGDKFFDAYRDVAPTFGAQRKLYRIGHLPTDGTENYLPFYFLDASGNQTDYGSATYPHDNISYAFEEAHRMEADITLCINLGDTEVSIKALINYLESTYVGGVSYMSLIQYFEISNEIGFTGNGLHDLYGCTAEQYINRAIDVSNWVREAADQEVTLGFVGAITGHWAGQGCEDAPAGWGEWEDYLPMMIETANSGGAKIDFFIFHNYPNYPLIDKPGLYVSERSMDFQYVWKNASGSTVASKECAYLPVGFYNIIVTDETGASYTATSNLDAAAYTCAPVEQVYNFIWSNGATTAAITELDGGNFTVTVSPKSGPYYEMTRDFRIYSDDEVYDYVMAINTVTKANLTEVQDFLATQYPSGVQWAYDGPGAPKAEVRIGCTEGGTEIYDEGSKGRPHLIRRAIEGLYSVDNIITAAKHRLLNNVHFCLIHHYYEVFGYEHGDNVFFDLYSESADVDQFAYPSYQVQKFLSDKIGSYLIPSTETLPQGTTLANFYGGTTPNDHISYVATKREDGTIAIIVLNKDFNSHQIDFELGDYCANEAAVKRLSASHFSDDHMTEQVVALSSLDNVNFPPFSVSVLEIAEGTACMVGDESGGIVLQDPNDPNDPRDPRGPRTQSNPRLATTADAGFEILELYPNPTSRSITIALSSASGSSASATLYNILGERVSTKSLELSTGLNSIQWEVRDLPSGLYYITIQSNMGRQVVEFIKE